MPVSDPLLDHLDDTQRHAVTCDAAPLAILAGAGSGKTRVLTRRIAWQARTGAIDAGHVLAVTFTRKAAGELGARLYKLGVSGDVTAGTFHAIALAQLRRRAEEAGRPIPELLTRKVRLLVPMLPERGANAGLAAAEVASEIEWAKARLVRPDGYAAAVAAEQREPPRPALEVAALYDRYETEKRKRRLVDFDDLIWRCADLLEEDAEFRSVQQWRFRHLFVDEFQDVNPAQVRLVRAWLGDRPSLCVVGDADQAIYNFAGADPSYLGDFDRHFPGGSVVQLGCNYRSSPQVVTAARAVLSTPAQVRTPRPDGPQPTVTAYGRDTDEATGVARRLRRAHAGVRRWSSIAVLYRTNAQSAQFEEALRAAGIPFRVRGDARFLERPEVTAALQSLRERARGSSDRPLVEHLDALAEAAAEEADERRGHTETLVRLGHEYLTADGGFGSVDGFVNFLTAALRGDETGSDDRDAVQLLTFHRAKGLEFDTVFVTGVEQGLVPISHASTPDQRDEERRLLYVALSRAMRELHVSWSRARTFGRREARRSPSPWLEDIEYAIAGVAPPPSVPRGEARRHLDRAKTEARGGTTSPGRRAAAELDADDSALFRDLVEWRLGLARVAGTPPYVIFHDTTLVAVASTRPRSRKALLTISGIGPVKAQRYGEAVLEVVARHAPVDGGLPRVHDASGDQTSG